MTLREYLKTEEGKTLSAVCYYGKNGRYYWHPTSRIGRTTALDRQVEQIVSDDSNKKTAWLL